MTLYEIFSKYSTSIISAFSVLMGSLVGSYFSWVTAKKTNCESIKEQYRLLDENRKYDLYHRSKDVAISANIIRLDIANAIFQSIRFYKEYTKSKKVPYYTIPSTKNYSSYVASLSEKYSVKELSYIYQLYGMIDRLNYITISYERYDEEVIVEAYILFLKKLYGDNYEVLLTIDDKKYSYKDLYNNRLMKKGYTDVLRKLDEICKVEEFKLNFMNKDQKLGKNSNEHL